MSTLLLKVVSVCKLELHTLIFHSLSHILHCVSLLLLQYILRFQYAPHMRLHHFSRTVWNTCHCEVKLFGGNGKLLVSDACFSGRGRDSKAGQTPDMCFSAELCHQARHVWGYLLNTVKSARSPTQAMFKSDSRLEAIRDSDPTFYTRNII